GRSYRPCPDARPGPKKIHRAGCAFVHLPREPSASAYGPRERLRPTHAPCSVQEGSYRAVHTRSRHSQTKSAHFATANVSTFPRRFSAPGDNPVESAEQLGF